MYHTQGLLSLYNVYSPYMLDLDWNHVLWTCGAQIWTIGTVSLNPMGQFFFLLLLFAVFCCFLRGVSREIVSHRRLLYFLVYVVCHRLSQNKIWSSKKQYFNWSFVMFVPHSIALSSCEYMLLIRWECYLLYLCWPFRLDMFANDNSIWEELPQILFPCLKCSAKY